VKIKGNEKCEFYSIQLQCHSTSHSTQPITCAGKCNPTQPMDGPNPCPSLMCRSSHSSMEVAWSYSVDQVGRLRVRSWLPVCRMTRSEQVSVACSPLIRSIGSAWHRHAAERWPDTAQPLYPIDSSPLIIRECAAPEVIGVSWLRAKD